MAFFSWLSVSSIQKPSIPGMAGSWAASSGGMASTYSRRASITARAFFRVVFMVSPAGNRPCSEALARDVLGSAFNASASSSRAPSFLSRTSIT
jgi:hypothetical protein